MSDELYEEIDHPGSIVTWAFYIDDPEGERRLRECLDAPKVLQAVVDFERWLRGVAETNSMEEKREALETARDVLFKCFTDNDVIVPGWE